MDSYEVHKKIQEAILALEIYNLKISSPRSSVWHAEIIKGMQELHKQHQTLLLFDGSAKGAVEEEKVERRV